MTLAVITTAVSRGAVAAWRFIRQLVAEARRDRVPSVAAEMAFFALLALPSLLLVIAGAAGFVGSWFGPQMESEIKNAIVIAMGSFLSPDAMRDFARPAVEDLFARGRGGVLSVGALLAIVSVSRMVRVSIVAMNIAYDVPHWRSGLRRRLLSVAMSLIGVVVIAIALPVIVAGPGLGEALSDRFGAPAIVGWAWRVAYWPAAVVSGILALAAFYHFAPNERSPFVRALPGAGVAALAWILAAFGLRTYVAVSISESAIGPLAAPTILLLWLYASALAVLVGAEVNALIDPSSPRSPDRRRTHQAREKTTAPTPGRAGSMEHPDRRSRTA